MRYTNEELQTALNYDTNRQPFLTWDERCEIHRAISYRLTYSASLELNPQLSAKMNANHDRLKNYIPEVRQYIYDKNNKLIIK